MKRVAAVLGLLLLGTLACTDRPDQPPPPPGGVDTVETPSEYGPCESIEGVDTACANNQMLDADSLGGPGAGDSVDLGEPQFPETAAESAAAYGDTNLRGAPKVKTARSPRLAGDCVAGQACKKTLTWTRPQNYNSATDKATVTWRQLTPASILATHANITGTADSQDVLAPADGSTGSFSATLCYVRTGVNTACNSPLVFTVQGTPPPLPPVTAVVSTRKAGGDTNWVKVVVTATGRDSTLAFWDAKGTNPTTRTVRKAGQTATDSIRRLLVPGDSSWGTVLPMGKKGTVVDTGTAVPWKIKDTRVPVDTATALQLSKIDVLPNTVTMVYSTPTKPSTQQFCPFLIFKDNHFALPTVYHTVSNGYCLGYFNYMITQGYLAASPAQQAKADAICLTWTATGGTIGVHTCPVPA